MPYKKAQCHSDRTMYKTECTTISEGKYEENNTLFTFTP